MERKLIVLTPVKNEAWILHRYLSVTSIFADHIIIADQQSTDGSLDIYPEYPKVDLIHNEGNQYNESDRQELLLQYARNKFGVGHILLALDADEIVAANALVSLGWKTMLAAKIGTVLHFEFPTFARTPYRVWRYPHFTIPVGFVDDGSPNVTSAIHSGRLPRPGGSPQLYLHDIKIMHYSGVRPLAQRSKLRMYNVLENTLKTKGWFRRRQWYGQNSKTYVPDFQPEPTPTEWFSDYEKAGIDMTTIEDQPSNWYDKATVEILSKHGGKRFRFDDIWDVDWNAISNSHTKIESRTPIQHPSKVDRMISGAAYKALDVAFRLKRRFF